MELSFEEKMKQLEDIVSQLENESLGLDESVKLYEKAKELSKALNEELQNSIKKMSYIVEDGEVKPYLEEEKEEKDI